MMVFSDSLSLTTESVNFTQISQATDNNCVTGKNELKLEPLFEFYLAKDIRVCCLVNFS